MTTPITKAEMVRRLSSRGLSNMPSVSELARYLHRDRKATRSFMAGLPVYAIGKCHCYMIDDVAARLLDSVR